MSGGGSGGGSGASAASQTSMTAGAATAATAAGTSAPTVAGVDCATARGSLPDSSITVCPGSAPVGEAVRITIKGCIRFDRFTGLPEMPASDLFFLGPSSRLGSGGGGIEVPFAPRVGSVVATATFTVPPTYVGGDEKGGSPPTLRTKAGSGYEFITDPAGACKVHFTVTR